MIGLSACQQQTTSGQRQPIATRRNHNRQKPSQKKPSQIKRSRVQTINRLVKRITVTIQRPPTVRSSESFPVQRRPLRGSYQRHSVFRDYADFPEKIADLHHALPTTGMPSGHAGNQGAIGYWSPDQRIVFYWD
ncbi:hypothetical protein S101258_00392 [Lactiplantibacillus plantarum subsp. plantarum]|uniref:Cyclophilin-like domain-containing protein n=1 Tax=Lactiplantibacillus plantarum subsp. plantarum TaxID=337330 RepID=A0A2S3U976_LACPN|nr:hypothetical protein S101258_00392 [Lactiplantibacillus plantarum subsp. plantarum]